MKVSVVAKGDVSRTLKIEVPSETVAAEYEKVYAKVSKTAALPGFRKGKVPRAILEPQVKGSVNQEVLEALLPRFVETEILRALLESSASEHGARMAAMDKASSNAGDMIAKLTLTMNKIRQASITNQIIEIVSGANA